MGQLCLGYVPDPKIFGLRVNLQTHHWPSQASLREYSKSVILMEQVGFFFMAHCVNFLDVGCSKHSFIIFHVQRVTMT